MSRLGRQENIGSALKTCQSHTIKHKLTNIVPKRNLAGHKGSSFSTEKFFSEEVQKSAYEQPQHE